MFENYTHPRLAAMGLAGAGWWFIGLVLWLGGPQQVSVAAALVHMLGLGTLIFAALVYGVLWWRDYVRSKL